MKATLAELIAIDQRIGTLKIYQVNLAGKVTACRYTQPSLGGYPISLTPAPTEAEFLTAFPSQAMRFESVLDE